MAPTAADRARGVAALFDRVADTYDAVGVPWFTPLGERLVTELAPRPGEAALDIGCGRGAALFPLADAVGPGGRVTGIDLSARMVAATRGDAEARGLGHVELHVMDATAVDLPVGTYDVVTSSLVLFFLPEPAAALAVWRSLLRSGGRIGVSTFGARDPRWEAVDDLFVPYLPPHLLDARTSGTAGPFATDEGVAALFTDAGYSGVRTVRFDLPVHFPDVETWHRWSWSHGQRVMWEAVPEAEQATVREGAYALLDGARDADGRIVLLQEIRLTIAAA